MRDTFDWKRFNRGPLYNQTELHTRDTFLIQFRFKSQVKLSFIHFIYLTAAEISDSKDAQNFDRFPRTIFARLLLNMSTHQKTSLADTLIHDYLSSTRACSSLIVGLAELFVAELLAAEVFFWWPGHFGLRNHDNDNIDNFQLHILAYNMHDRNFTRKNECLNCLK